MMRSIVRMFLGLCLTASAAAPLAAQAGRIRGTVSDSAGTGLANAALTVEGTALRGVSRTGASTKSGVCPLALTPSKYD